MWMVLPNPICNSNSFHAYDSRSILNTHKIRQCHFLNSFGGIFSTNYNIHMTKSTNTYLGHRFS